MRPVIEGHNESAGHSLVLRAVLEGISGLHQPVHLLKPQASPPKTHTSIATKPQLRSNHECPFGKMASTQFLLGPTPFCRRDTAILEKLKTTKEYVSPAELAVLYASLWDKENALASLERAYATHDPQMIFLKVDPHYDSLRSDPRFQNKMQQLRLTP